MCLNLSYAGKIKVAINVCGAPVYCQKMLLPWILRHVREILEGLLLRSPSFSLQTCLCVTWRHGDILIQGRGSLVS